MLASLRFNASRQKTDSRRRISPAEKLRFKNIEQRPERLDLSRRRQIEEAIFDESLSALHSVDPEQTARLKMEIEKCMARFSQLTVQLRTGNASLGQVLWSLTTRFFIPWIALRTAFHFRQNSTTTADGPCEWLVSSLQANPMGSCFMNAVDLFIRQPHETDAALERRLKKRASFSGNGLQRDFRRCRG
ncbi:MAG TPA: hypothetical protein VMF06_15725, partial [Candidatus Limnocylindria bacterium]|nr:hypothetical protein [Candidatus Limnocylindria bacterium]